MNEMKLLTKLGKITGIGGVAIGALVLLLKDILANSAFKSLPPEQSYQLLLTIIIGLFVIGVLGIIAWIISIRPTKGTPKVKADKGSVALGDNASNNTITVNNSHTSEDKNV